MGTGGPGRRSLRSLCPGLADDAPLGLTDRKPSMLKQRLIFGTLMIVAIVALLAADRRLDRSDWLADLLPGAARPRGALFTLLVGVLTLAASAELYRMARAKGLRPLGGVGALAAAALAVSPFVARLDDRLAMLPLWVLAFAVMAVFFAQAAGRRTDNAIANIAATLLAVGYLGGLALFAVKIRLDHHTVGLLAYLAAVKFTDIGAWAAGVRFGRHKMIPWLSPGKSWEGMAGGTAAAITVSLAIGLPSGLFGPWQAVVFGLVLAPAGQLADLAESLLKRDSGLKDSGAVVPAFGGLLDVLDSPLGAAPVGYLLLGLLAC